MPGLTRYSNIWRKTTLNAEQQNIEAEWYKYRACLYDRASGLPTVAAVIDEVSEMLEKERTIGIIYHSFGDQTKIEPVFGWETYDELIKLFTICVVAEVRKILPKTAIVAVSSLSSDSFFIFLDRASENTKISKEYLEDLRNTLLRQCEKVRMEYKKEELKERINFYSASEMLKMDPMVRTERQVNQAIEDVKYSAHFKEKLHERELYFALQKIIRNAQIATVYQPIYDLERNLLYGYEALSRGPTGTYFEDADAMFTFAAKSDLVMPFEKICLERAITGARALPAESFIFLNVTPASVPELIESDFMNIIKKSGLNINNVVIEITEKYDIPDYRQYRTIINKIQVSGFKIALDDVGIGYSTLERISEITPDYLKYDRTLVRDIDKSLVRQELIKSFVDFAHNINATIIAEGIEKKAELDFVKKAGIVYGQGFYLGIPAPVAVVAKS